ncbi:MULTISPECIES: DUF2875 family protein [Pseudomonas]|uniref:type VI lipase adapter Tla3 domain-containing protein n=1 Tax=Pseudomonas TaxID=286 RepID=UPI001B3CAAAB|nr:MULTISPECIES: DUF2875 family protein [unclassified Pseudomonas]MBP1126899.1 hypothetical protein [Pseudomonas sp. PvP025]MDQ0400759.1 hypothetical protein [Pseudomonas sp. PvP006]
MSADQGWWDVRPKLKGYFFAAFILLSLWFGFDWFIGTFLQTGSQGIKDMRTESHWKLAGVLGLLVIVFSAHWAAKTEAATDARLDDYRTQAIAKKAEKIAEQTRTYALEIRGTGLAVDDWHQSSIWREIEKKKDNFASIYSQNPSDYDPSLTSRETTQSLNIRVAFKHSAGNSVAYWPIPVFAIAPPKQPGDIGAAGNINRGRNAATLGVTLFLWQDAENTTHAQGMIERLFQFFDDNPMVPQALIVSRDGDVTRNGYRVAGTPGLPGWLQVVPTVFESMTGLLVTRSDRVDRYIRPYVTNDKEDNQNKNTDLGKLWAFYWDRSRAFDDWYLKAERAKGANPLYAPSTMPPAPCPPPTGRPSSPTSGAP